MLFDFGNSALGCHRRQGRDFTQTGSFESLDEHFAMTSEDGNRQSIDCMVIRKGHSGHQRKRRVTINLCLPGKTQGTCHGEPDTKAGKAARPAIDDDGACPAFVRQLCDHRRKTFGMAAADNFVLFRDNRIAIEQRDRTGLACCVDGQDHRVRGSC